MTFINELILTVSQSEKPDTHGLCPDCYYPVTVTKLTSEWYCDRCDKRGELPEESDLQAVRQAAERVHGIVASWCTKDIDEVGYLPQETSDVD